MNWRVLEGDALAVLRTLEDGSVQTCVTSPPYFGLRDYGNNGQVGLEPTPDEYVARLVEVFREVRRVLRDDGTLWLNLGDSYAGSWGNQGRKSERGTQRPINGDMLTPVHDGRYPSKGSNTGAVPDGVKPKDLLGIPWMVAFALRADGWYLRSDIIWAKPNPMPESVTDRPTKAHEYLFLLSKSPRYFYDTDAVREDALQPEGVPALTGQHKVLAESMGTHGSYNGSTLGTNQGAAGRNKRSVWTVATQPFPGAHFAVFPPKLIEPCVLAGSAETACGVCGAPWERISERTIDDSRPLARQNINEPQVTQNGDGTNAKGSSTWGHYLKTETKGWRPTCTHQRPAYGSETFVAGVEVESDSDDTGTSVVLDPFSGAGTTGLVATRLGRSYIGIELNPVYAEMSRKRIRDDAPLMNYLDEVS